MSHNKHCMPQLDNDDHVTSRQARHQRPATHEYIKDALLHVGNHHNEYDALNVCTKCQNLYAGRNGHLHKLQHQAWLSCCCCGESAPEAEQGGRGPSSTCRCHAANVCDLDARQVLQGDDGSSCGLPVHYRNPHPWRIYKIAPESAFGSSA